MPFKDHFSTGTDAYLRFRPVYPDALFDVLASLAPRLDRALDCACGSGQATRGLARVAGRALGADASLGQVRAARAATSGRGRPSYFCARSEATGLPDASVDLVTVAQALHWFDFEPFWREVRRIVRPGGVVAVWCLAMVRITPAVDAAIDRAYERVGPYWPRERRYVEEAYASIPFPFPRLDVPDLECRSQWRVEDLVGYMSTWSARRRYMESEDSDPVELARDSIVEAWGRAFKSDRPLGDSADGRARRRLTRLGRGSPARRV